MRLKTYFGDVKYINPSKTPRPTSTHRRKFKVFKKTFHITGQGRTRHGGGYGPSSTPWPNKKTYFIENMSPNLPMCVRPCYRPHKRRGAGAKKTNTFFQ